MNLVRINDVVGSFGISSRTLRYYEQAGLLWSARPDNKAQRYYDDAALERLRQIIVLRKLQIPVKDITAIFNDSGTAALIGAFVDKLDALDGEIASLKELRRLVDDFLQKMLSAGITRISAITLLYEETERRLTPAAVTPPITMKRLTDISRDALRLHDVRLIRLPSSRVLVSRRRTGETVALDADTMQNLFADFGILPAPGLRGCFFLRKPGDEWLMTALIPEDYVNTSPYAEEFFGGGLYALASSFMEDMDETFVLLKAWIAESEDYALDLDINGALKRDEMIEEILPWDIARRTNRYQQDVFVPVRLKERKETE
jgi:DNA-binding transcriptional MerR regulator